MLGREPLPEKLTLTLGADFTHIIDIQPPEILPVGTVVHLRLYPPGETDTLTFTHEWAAIVTASRVEFRVESTEADEVEDRAHFRMYVSYPDTPTLEHCWYLGDVVRKQ